MTSRQQPVSVIGGIQQTGEIVVSDIRFVPCSIAHIDEDDNSVIPAENAAKFEQNEENDRVIEDAIKVVEVSRSEVPQSKIQNYQGPTVTENNPDSQHKEDSTSQSTRKDESLQPVVLVFHGLTTKGIGIFGGVSVVPSQETVVIQESALQEAYPKPETEKHDNKLRIEDSPIPHIDDDAEEVNEQVGRPTVPIHTFEKPADSQVKGGAKSVNMSRDGRQDSQEVVSSQIDTFSENLAQNITETAVRDSKSTEKPQAKVTNNEMRRQYFLEGQKENGEGRAPEMTKNAQIPANGTAIIERAQPESYINVTEPVKPEEISKQIPAVNANLDHKPQFGTRVYISQQSSEDSSNSVQIQENPPAESLVWAHRDEGRPIENKGTTQENFSEAPKDSFPVVEVPKQTPKDSFPVIRIQERRSDEEKENQRNVRDIWIHQSTSQQPQHTVTVQQNASRDTENSLKNDSFPSTSGRNADQKLLNGLQNGTKHQTFIENNEREFDGLNVQITQKSSTLQFPASGTASPVSSDMPPSERKSPTRFDTLNNRTISPTQRRPLLTADQRSEASLSPRTLSRINHLNVIIESNNEKDGAEVIHHHPIFVKDTSKYWYKPAISREDAINMLKTKPAGTFVVRDSNSFPGAFGLALKVAHPPAGVAVGDGTELVRHFLIEPSPKGVKLKGCANEPVFGTLAALVYQHSITPLALPCKLILPDYDPAVAPEHLNSNQALLERGAACNVTYLFSVGTESLTGPEALRRSAAYSIDLLKRGEMAAVPVHFKVSAQGITLTDNTRTLFFRRHFPANSITYAGIDPESRLFDNNNVAQLPPTYVRQAPMFGFVARKFNSGPAGGENYCHVFAELDPDQPASAVVRFITNVMMPQAQAKLQQQHKHQV
ncbi:phosphotyrosine-binding domain-containing protein [Ditylenchus destructor]|uniref:Phosphotyrosine-binding domain-containing protein n=1 Tax=Ditylenchus destructor TaxID=166010 RepID=A0AAD4N9U5_9BILA|nr:phosphotyrosine-binding domain-containing protein [Ditylenchus destructor]